MKVASPIAAAAIVLTSPVVAVVALFGVAYVASGQIEVKAMRGGHDVRHRRAAATA